MVGKERGKNQGVGGKRSGEGGVVYAHGDDVTGPAPRHKFNREVRQLSQTTNATAVSSLYTGY